MKILIAIALLLLPTFAFAQGSQRNPCFYPTPTSNNCTPVSTTTPLPVNASVSASISGFAPATYGTPITATTGGGTGTLPAGAVVVATNVGTTNAAFCKLGGTSDSTGQYISPGGGWFAFTVGGSTQLTCSTSTSTTTINTVGGTGLPTGTGGGSGSGGSSSNASVSTTATAVPGSATYIGINTGGNLVGWTGAVSQSGTWVMQPGNTANTTAWLVTGTGGTFPVTQATASNLNATVVGTGTFAVQAAQSGTWNVSQATAANLNATVAPSTLAAWGLTASTQNGATPTNSQLVMGQFNTTPTTITSGNVSPLQMDAAGNLLVNIKAGAGSGGTASSFGSAFPSTGTAIGFTDGTNMVAGRVRSNGSTATTTDASVVVVDPNVLAAVNSPIPAGTNVIGDVNIRQGGTALSATNGIYSNLLVGNAAVATGAGAAGATSPRVTNAQDTTTIAGSAPGTAGTPSANVLSVQGVANGTAQPISLPVNQTQTDCSGAVATGGTALNAFAASSTRRGFTIMNIDTTEVLWVNITGTATAAGTGSFPLPPATATTFAGAGSYTSPPGQSPAQALSVLGATTGHKWSCWTW